MNGFLTGLLHQSARSRPQGLPRKRTMHCFVSAFLRSFQWLVKRRFRKETHSLNVLRRAAAKRYPSLLIRGRRGGEGDGGSTDQSPALPVSRVFFSCSKLLGPFGRRIDPNLLRPLAAFGSPPPSDARLGVPPLHPIPLPPGDERPNRQDRMTHSSQRGPTPKSRARAAPSERIETCLPGREKNENKERLPSFLPSCLP